MKTDSTALKNEATGPQVEQLGAALGAEITGVDVRRPLTPEAAELLRHALDQHQVIVLRNQNITHEQQIEFAKVFGFPGTHEPTRTLGLLDGKPAPAGDLQIRDPNRRPNTDRWHVDVTYAPRPPTVGTLSMKRAPKIGGDTAFVSLLAIYESLSPPMQQLCAQLKGLHTIEPMEADGFPIDERIRRMFPPREHPLVLPHPRNGRKALYIGADNTWILRLTGIHNAEADALLRYLRTQLDNIEFQFRWKWAPGDLLVWDQRAVAHMGLGDHYAFDPYREVFSVWCYMDDEPQVTAG